MKIKGIAHRGDPVNYPENTLTAFRAAYELDFTHTELDVHLSKDGVPVIMHDFAIDRMTNGTGLIRDYTVAELKQFVVKETETIPTLEEVLKLLKGNMNVLIELKQKGDLYPGLEEKVLDVVRRTDTLDQSRIISFDYASLQRVRELVPDIELGPLCHRSLPDIIPFMKQFNCTFLGIHLSLLTPEYADKLIENGFINSPWPIETIEEMEVIASTYPNSLITTNHLERWTDFYRSHPELQI
ncbi:MAG: glycerophosphodiester phosphodiesterase [Paenibacillus sp.]|jgi:glycerophosphoryl diester phosphodiesterase|nr:glycerophosphodiester phosphodiesterase [Paenibacillus sp.]